MCLLCNYSKVLYAIIKNGFNMNATAQVFAMRLKRNLLFLSCLSVIASVYADNEPIQLPSIQVKAKQRQDLAEQTSRASSATKIDMPLKDVPQTVNVIPVEVLRDQGVTSLQGALQNVAGIGFNTGDARSDQISIRGFNAIFDNYVDGLRDDAMYYRDLSNTERIEVLKGPASVLYGRGSAGGIVNRITKKPLDDVLREVSLSGSTIGQRRTEIDVNQPISPNVKLRVTGAVEDSKGYRDQAFLKRQVISPSLLWDISDHTQLLLQADYLHDDRLADQGVPVNPATHKALEVGRKQFLGAANAKDVGDSDTEISSQTITLDHQFDNDWKYHGVIHAYHDSLDRQYANASYNANTQMINLTQVRRIRKEKGQSTSQEVSGTFKTGEIEHQGLVGVELSHQDKQELLFASPAAYSTSIHHIVLPEWAPINTAKARAVNENDNTTTGIYLQDLMTLSPQFKMLLGVRYDDLNQKRSVLTVNTGAIIRYNRQDDTFSPRVGLVYQPQKNLSLYASYNQSFQPLTDSLVVYNNLSALAPTKTESYEVGAKWDVTPDYNLTLSIFNTTQNNILQADPTDSTRALLAGEQQTKGVELSGVGQLTTRLSLLAGYAYLDGQMKKSVLATVPKGANAPLTPKHAANFWLKYQLDDAWFVAVGGRAQTRQYASPDNQLVLAGYAVMNAAGGYHTQRYDVNLNLNNLFNTHYYASANGSSNTGVLAGDPLNAQLSLRYRF